MSMYHPDSRLSVYETCQRQYRYKYVDRVPTPDLKTAKMFEDAAERFRITGEPSTS
jgi:hypothetical protein